MMLIQSPLLDLGRRNRKMQVKNIKLNKSCRVRIKISYGREVTILVVLERLQP